MWTVPAELSGLRLDKALAAHPEILSRTRAARLIERQAVRQADRVLKASHTVLAGDVFRIDLPASESSTLQPLTLALNIVFEDETLLVVDKPAGLVVHPAAGHAQDTLVNALIHHTSDLAMGFGQQRPGIVHRLDKDTSGLLVVAKTDSAQHHLAEQFKSRTIHRIYHAIVHGRPRLDQDSVESYLRRHPTDRKRFASEKLSLGQAPTGKYARTHYQVLKTHLLGFSLLKVKLETGRTHQIRVHMSELGHPLIGDRLYGARSHLSRVKSLTLRENIEELRRIGLHAAELGFRHPISGRDLLFKAPWPDDLKTFLTFLEWL